MNTQSIAILLATTVLVVLAAVVSPALADALPYQFPHMLMQPSRSPDASHMMTRSSCLEIGSGEYNAMLSRFPPGKMEKVGQEEGTNKAVYEGVLVEPPGQYCAYQTIVQGLNAAYMNAVLFYVTPDEAASLGGPPVATATIPPAPRIQQRVAPVVSTDPTPAPAVKKVNPVIEPPAVPRHHYVFQWDNPGYLLAWGRRFDFAPQADSQYLGVLLEFSDVLKDGQEFPVYSAIGELMGCASHTLDTWIQPISACHLEAGD